MKKIACAVLLIVFWLNLILYLAPSASKDILQYNNNPGRFLMAIVLCIYFMSDPNFVEKAVSYLAKNVIAFSLLAIITLYLVLNI